MVKNSNKNTNTNINKDDDKILNQIDIKIDLGNLAKQTKPRRKSKPKPKPMDDMKTGATINTASSLAPVKFGGPKIPSTDTGFNPNSSYNMLLLQALQNALTESDANALKYLLHTLKGYVTFLCNESLASQLIDIEA